MSTDYLGKELMPSFLPVILSFLLFFLASLFPADLLLSILFENWQLLPNKLIWQSQNPARFTLLSCPSSAKVSDLCVSGKAEAPYL